MPPRAAFILLAAACCAAAQAPAHQHAGEAAIPLQPLAQQVRRLEDAMNYLGQPFPAADHSAINAAIANADDLRKKRRDNTPLSPLEIRRAEQHAGNRGPRFRRVFRERRINCL